jgi:hypothetical protein
MITAIRPTLIGKSSLVIATATATVSGSSESATEAYGTAVVISGRMPDIGTIPFFVQDVVTSCSCSDDYSGESVSNRSTAVLYGFYFEESNGSKIKFSSGYDYSQIGSLSSYGRSVNYGYNHAYTGINMMMEGNNYYAGGATLNYRYGQLAGKVPVKAGLWLKTTNCSCDITLKLSFIWTNS